MERGGKCGGAVFLNYQADPRFSGFITLIYGHRMPNKSVFGSLKHYEDTSFWQENPSVTIANEDDTWQYDIYAAYEVGLTAETYLQEFTGPKKKQDFIQYSLVRSVIDIGIIPTLEDTIITFSTCSRGDHNTR